MVNLNELLNKRKRLLKENEDIGELHWEIHYNNPVYEDLVNKRDNNVKEIQRIEKEILDSLGLKEGDKVYFEGKEYNIRKPFGIWFKLASEDGKYANLFDNIFKIVINEK